MVLRARSGNTCRETFAGHGGVFVLKPAQNPGTDEGGGHEVPSHAEGLLAIDDCWVGTVCLQGCGPRKATHAPVGRPRPKHVQMASSQFNGFQKQAHEIGKGK